MRKNAAVLLSGGVDSSVAAILANQQFNLKAYYLKIWLEDDAQFLGNCPFEEDLSYVEDVCHKLNIPFEIVPLQSAYYERVVSYTVEELKAGRTPSPDIFCNQRIKFGAFLDLLNTSDPVVSGHYARVLDSHLFLAKDRHKDQTYFLSRLSANQLSQCVFPLGDYLKSEVRQIAAENGLNTSTRKDSQGICFLGKIPYDDFVRFHLGEKIGDIVDVGTGDRLGQHKGYWFHTIGQRKGLGLSGGPWFVVKKDCQANIIYVDHSNNQSQFFIDQMHWIHGEEVLGTMACKVRHGEKLYTCSIAKNDKFYEVKLEMPDSGIASGQYCILYRSEECLGGGRMFVD
jgi:tRNA-uridine 2-sulfurtransferase